VLTLRDLLEQPPLMHQDRTTTWAIRPALAEFLDERVTPGSVTLETGAGLSTLVILRKRPRQHIAVQPVVDEFAVVLEFAEQHGMDIRGFRPIVARSQEWLPGAELPELDLALVDGAHAFPVPFIDWYYAAEKLKVGGLMIVDDTHLVTGTILADFMEADPAWEHVRRDDSAFFATYRKRRHPVHDDDWTRQPYVHDAYPTEKVQLIQAVQSPGAGVLPADPGVDLAGRRLTYVEIRGWREYQHYRAAMTDESRRRQSVELSLVPPGAESFQVDGYCAVCDRATRFTVGLTYSYQRAPDGRSIPNWREHLTCECGFNNRLRAAIQILRQEVRPQPGARMYTTERLTGLYRWLEAHYPNLVGSEYLGGTVPRGAVQAGVRNEDLTALTFPDESFDLILSFDVMEHVPDSAAALGECLRCLRPGGTLVLGAPFCLDRPETVERARAHADGTIEHLMPAEYHANPVDPEKGALCFRDFGWQLLDQMKDAGFSDPRALLYWSRELGYLGGDQVLFLACRPGRGAPADRGQR
jgi:SAM-dependent methyltransferase